MKPFIPHQTFRIVRPALSILLAAGSVASASTTGFWHVEKIDGRDWAVAPDGQPAVLAGVDWVWPAGFHCEALGYSPYGRFVETNYPSREAWADETAARLHAWGFNFLGSGCDDALLAPRGFAHTAMLNVGYSLAHDKDKEKAISPGLNRPGTAFPNVFHPDFEAAWDRAAAHAAEKYRDDPNLLGYYLDNELSWGGVSRNRDEGMFDAVAALPEGHSARKALEQWLAGEEVSHRDTETQSLGKDTTLLTPNGVREGVSRVSGEQIRALNKNLCGSVALCDITSVTHETKVAFLAFVAERYFSVAAEAVRRHDPNHMVLGCRFAGLGAHEAVLKAAARHCDIVTFNYYPWADLDQGVVFNRKDGRPMTDVLRDFHDKVGAPLLITEWSFSALDTGRPCSDGAGQRFRTQAERVEAAELFARTLLSLPFMVGHAWFMWVDQPALGFNKYFHEDCNYGLVSEEGVPYPALTEMFTRLHRDAARLRTEPGSGLSRKLARSGKEAPDAKLSEREKFFAVASKSVAAGAPSPADAVVFALEGDRWSLTNAAGIRLSGRIGSSSMVDELVRDGRLYGSLNARVMTTAPSWPPVTRLVSAKGATDPATGCASVTLIGEKSGANLPQPPRGVAGPPQRGAEGGTSFAIAIRLTLAPDNPDILAEILSVKNLGGEPLSVQKLFLCPIAGGDAPPVRVPMPVNVWKGWNESHWRLADGARYGAVSHDESADGFNLWTEADGSQHADIPFRPRTAPVTLAPGEALNAPRPMGARILLTPP